VEVHFLQIYYATIKCILFGEGGTRYGLFLMSFVVCLILYVGGRTNIEHTYTKLLKSKAYNNQLHNHLNNSKLHKLKF
jgi:hypothetical protein